MAFLLFVPYGSLQHYLLQCTPGSGGSACFPVSSLFEADTSRVVNDTASFATVGDTVVRLHRLRVAAQRYEGRLVWMFFIGISTLLYGAGIGVGILLIRGAPRARGNLVPYFSAMALPAAALVWFFGQNAESHMIIMSPVLKHTIANGGVLLGLQSVPDVMNWFNAATYGVTLFMLLACCVLIAPERNPPSVPDAESLTAAIDALSAQMRSLRIFLYVGTVLLVVGVLRMNAVFSWAYSFLAIVDAAALQGIRLTSVSILGAFYSLLLACVYVPAAWVLRERAAALIRVSGALPEARQQQAARTDISLSLADAFPRILAIVAPLLTGPVGELVGRLSS